MAVNVCYLPRKEKKDPKGNLEIIRAATPTADPECTGKEKGGRGGTRLFQRMGPLPQRKPQHRFFP